MSVSFVLRDEVMNNLKQPDRTDTLVVHQFYILLTYRGANQEA